MSIFANYFGAIEISDGKRSEWTTADKITCKNADGTIATFHTKSHNGYKKVLWEVKLARGNKLVEWLKFGAFHKFYKPSGNVILRFYKKSMKMMHGMTERYDELLFGKKGICRTLYSHGRFVSQEFRYKNRKLGFKLRHNDKRVVVKYPDGKIAGIIECPGRGFSTRAGDPEKSSWREGSDDIHTCYQGHVYFSTTASGWKTQSGDIPRFLDYSKEGNCIFSFFDRRGKLLRKGEFHNRQRVGEWRNGAKSDFYLNGIPASKKLWNTKPEDLKVNSVIRIKNAQLRAALLARIGPERVAKEGKSKIIHQTKDGMKLMQFPVRVDDGNGRQESWLRILQVTCPSTKNLYYLNVPDFVWDGGKRTKLDNCEAARQWTFGVDDPRKKIKFAVET